MRKIIIIAMLFGAFVSVNADAQVNLISLKKEKRSLQAKINFSDANKQIKMNSELLKLKEQIELANEAYLNRKRELLVQSDPKLKEIFTKLEVVEKQLQVIEK